MSGTKNLHPHSALQRSALELGFVVEKPSSSFGKNEKHTYPFDYGEFFSCDRGVVTIDVKLDELDIQQCPGPFHEPNAFKNTARCDYETTYVSAARKAERLESCTDSLLDSAETLMWIQPCCAEPDAVE